MAQGRVIIKDTGYFKMLKIHKELISLSKQSAVVGFPSDLGNHEDSNIPLVDIAVKNEFGSPGEHIPERSFIRSSANNKSSRAMLLNVVEVGLNNIYLGFGNAESILKKGGEFWVGVIKEKIRNGPFAPLSSKTIARRKTSSTKPLIDTGDLRNSVTYRIRRS